jgi:hypothetical protein
VADHLWKLFGAATVNVMADGARTLAMLWDSAWKEGGGTAAMAGKGKISESNLKNLYTQPKFLESFTLAQIQTVLSGPASGAVGATPVSKKRKAGPGTKRAKTRVPKKALRKKLSTTRNRLVK